MIVIVLFYKKYFSPLIVIMDDQKYERDAVD
jgi:hypothetical protein